MHITKKVYMNLQKYSELKNKDVLVSYSAGADSTALLYILNKQKDVFNWNIKAVFFNHANSPISEGEDKSLQCAKELTNKLGIELMVNTIDMKKTVNESWEELGRKGRLEFFKNNNFDAIFLGHHEDDQNETTMMQLFRGGGRGVAGMKLKEGKIYRPFLNIRKEEIYNFLREEKLNWIEDPTNVNIDFTRNFWRKFMLPEIEKHYPGYNTSLKNFREKQTMQNNLLYDLAVVDGLEKIINKEVVDISKLSEERKINLVQNLGTSMQSYIEINKIKNALKIFNNTKKNHVILSSSKYDLHLTGNNQLLEVECVPQLNLNKKNNKKMI